MRTPHSPYEAGRSPREAKAHRSRTTSSARLWLVSHRAALSAWVLFSVTILVDATIVVSRIVFDHARASDTLLEGALSLVVYGAVATALWHVLRPTRPGHVGLLPAKLGSYVVGSRIGEGGMGTVYEAHHATLGRRAAVKLIREASMDDDARERFEREAKITSELSHPNAVALYDYGETSQGVTFAAMELVEGVTLDELVSTEGALPPGRVLHLLRQIAAALAHAHERRLVHRDIKPSNVMITHREGHPDLVKVLDFGLAKHTLDHESRLRVVGTPQFMAPESVSHPETVGPPADVYAVGALAYFLLTGSFLFDQHRKASLPRAHESEPPLPPSLRTRNEIPRALEAVVLRCLAKSQADRYEDGHALLAALEACEAEGWTTADAEAWWAEQSSREDAVSKRDAAKTPEGAARFPTVPLDLVRTKPRIA